MQLHKKYVLHAGSLGHPRFQDTLLAQPDIVLESMAKGAPLEDAATRLARAHVYQLSSGLQDLDPNHLVDRTLLARMPNLLAVSASGAGYDTVDVAACTERQVLVVNQAGGANAQAVVEHALGMMLALSKRIAKADRALRSASAAVNKDEFVGLNLSGKTLGIHGFGRVGQALCRAASLALGMQVLVADSHKTPDFVQPFGAELVELDRLCAESDALVVCSSLTDETRRRFSAREFGLMKAEALFICVSRGGICDEAALENALARQAIGGAALDVWLHEPVAVGHPLLRFDNFLGTPHIAGATVDSRVDGAVRAATQIIDILQGIAPPRVVNRGVLPAFLERYERLSR